MDGRAIRDRRIADRLVGPLVGAVAVGVGQLAAAFGTPAASPVVAIGQAAIDLSPQPVRSWAIATFGTRDKAVLVGGILVVLGLLSLLVAPAAVRRPAVGFWAIGGAAGLGVAAAMTRPSASPGWAVPSLLAGAAAAVAFGVLTRPVRLEVMDGDGRPLAFDRRRFLRAALAVGAVGVGSVTFGVRRSREREAVAAARSGLRIPTPADPAAPIPRGAGVDVPGAVPFVTPTDRFYRVDTALFVPEVDPRTWTLRIHGMVDRELELDLHSLLRRPLIERDVTLSCVSNPVGGRYVGNARWIGAALAPLLREAGISPEADQLISRSVDGFTAGTPMRLVLDGRDAMLAVAMNGAPLPTEHGFPVRMVVPGLYGYESATKWLAELEATTYAAYDAYWVQRGWARYAPIRTQSRIDTPRVRSTVRAGRVPVAGVAWAQHTGISRVEVCVDGGRWNEATLAAQDTVDTWRQWRWDWDATPGAHVLSVRATDANGITQPGTPTDPFPAGATGWHTIPVTVA